METKNITIPIPIDIYNRVEKLRPAKKNGRHDIAEFYTEIFLDGIAGPRFIIKEARRNTTKLEMKISLLKHKLSVARKQLGQEDEKELPDGLTERLAQQFEALQDSGAMQVMESITAPAAKVKADPLKADAETTPARPGNPFDDRKVSLPEIALEVSRER